MVSSNGFEGRATAPAQVVMSALPARDLDSRFDVHSRSTDRAEAISSQPERQVNGRSHSSLSHNPNTPTSIASWR
jgi:hypothetical protein